MQAMEVEDENIKGELAELEKSEARPKAKPKGKAKAKAKVRVLKRKRSKMPPEQGEEAHKTPAELKAEPQKPEVEVSNAEKAKARHLVLFSFKKEK